MPHQATSSAQQKTTPSFDPEVFRAHFPILERRFDDGKSLVYLDNAATSQKPDVVIQAINGYYQRFNSNIHRGAHRLATEATDAYEKARETAASFLHAASPRLVNFTKGTTDGINAVASGLSQSWLRPGDEILISAMEHHANIVPWQMACQRSGAVLRVIPLAEDGSLDMEAARSLISEKTRVLALVWVSNSLGSINPVEELISLAQAAGAQVLLDAAQAAVHETIDVQALGVDYLVFSGHKVYGPTGTGILYGREDRLEALPPYQGGGEMIKEVHFEQTTYNDLPYKFEAGTPNIAGGIGLGEALAFMMAQDREGMARHETALRIRAEAHVDALPGVKRYSSAAKRTALISFLVDGVHAYDLGVLLDQQGIALRTGHHCCQPLMRQYGIEGTVRASFLPYNTELDIDAFGQALVKAVTMLG